MKRSRTIFYIVFILFHVVLFAFAFIVEANKSNFDFLIAMRARIPWMKYVSGAGLILVIIDYIMVRLDLKRHDRRQQKIEDEKNELKARMYDMMNQDTGQEDSTALPSDPSPSGELNSEQEEEKNGS